MQNLDAEIPKADWDFERLVRQTREKWDRELSRIEIEGSQWDKETFYTGMYHAFLAPNLYEDVTGEYRGLDSNIHQAKGFKNYAVFSLWDTFRATHPLFALIQPQRDSDMINSLLAHYDQSVDHLLPLWSLQGNETWCMIGYHAVPVIVDGYLKGVKGFDKERAYQAIKTTAMNPDYDGVAAYAKLGWVPCDLENESVSKTLEYAFDDYCIARMARGAGEERRLCLLHEAGGQLQECLRSLHQPGPGQRLARKLAHALRPPCLRRGDRRPTSPKRLPRNIPSTIPRMCPAMIALIGGREKFIQQLDALFDYKEPVKNQAAEDIQGRIGEYWHGNEPSHHIIYLYCYAGQPWKAARRLHEVIKTQYGNQPNSLSGNDDCGQMSAWYIFTALGFYPVCPGQRLLRHRQPGGEEGRHSPLQRQEVHHAGGESLRPEYLCAVGEAEWPELGPRPSCPTAN